MRPYIFGKRNSIHIIDIRETVKGLLRAKKFLTAVVSRGHDVLLVGTKRQARDSVEKQAARMGMPHVTQRWLGGTLTNFKTIRSRLARLEEIEDEVKSGKIESYSKKMRSVIDRERRKISRNLEGIRHMKRLPGALVVVDVKREYIAIKEARKLGIPTIGLVDTDSDPDTSDILIPGNDDAMRAIEIIIEQLAEAVEIGKRSRPTEGDDDAQAGPAPADGARRSTRLTTSELAAQQISGTGDEPAEDTPSIGGDSPAAPVATPAAAPVAASAAPETPETPAAPVAAPATPAAPVEAGVADVPAGPAQPPEVQDAAQS